MHPKAVMLMLQNCRPYVLFSSVHVIGKRVEKGESVLVAFHTRPGVWRRCNINYPELYVPAAWEDLEDELDLLTEDDIAWITGVK